MGSILNCPKKKPMTKRYAVIEIGTRGLRLLVADASPSGIEQVIYSTGDRSELGRDQTAKGTIVAHSIARTKAIVADYLNLAKQHKAEEILAFSTEIVRTAKNRAKFVRELGSIVKVQVLTREEEALYSLVASLNAFRHKLGRDETALVIDQGGGSTELSCGSVRSDGAVILLGYDSLPIGTVGLTRLLSESETVKNGYERVREIVKTAVYRHMKFAALSKKPPAVVFGLGSAITMLAEFQNPKNDREKKSLWRLHGQFISTESLQKSVEKTGSQLEKMGEKSNTSVDADSDWATLVSGVVTYKYILEKYEARGIIVSRYGLRYGVLIAQAGQPCIINT
jgi:exopolyphosphatase/pppGpp-phosphohydrolase